MRPPFRARRRLIVLLLVWVLFPLKLDAQSTYDRIGQALGDRIKAIDLPGAEVVALVQDARVRITVYEQHASEPMQPGRLSQVLTAALALEEMDADFRFTTTYRMFGPVEDRTLEGVLAVEGTGDPTVDTRLTERPEDIWERFDRLADALAKRGIRRIAGGLIADAGHFDDTYIAPGWPSERLGEPELPSVAALNFNGNCMEVIWQTGKTSGVPPEQYVFFPALKDYVHFANNVEQVSLPNRPVQFDRVERSDLINALGELPLRSTVRRRFAVGDPPLYYLHALRHRLAEHNITVEGELNKRQAGDSVQRLDAGQIIQTEESPPLRIILRQMMCHNLTLHGEVVFKTIGLEAPGAVAEERDFQAGARMMESFLARLHLPGSAPIVMDGSGCSRFNRLSAEQLLGVFRAARAGPYGELFEGLFAQPWQPGVLADRFHPPEDRKTHKPPPLRAAAASGENFEALAGWVRHPSGNELLFVIRLAADGVSRLRLRHELDSLARVLFAGS